MSYAQTNYLQKQGNSSFTIAEIGCFVTAICNMLNERFGDNIDPPSLNEYYTVHNLYDADPADGAGVKDDLDWNSPSKFNPLIVVTSVGGAGWPTTNASIVKFAYISPRSGQATTHFCLVADHAAHTIVDSWDGVTKQAGIYGTPVAWATYDVHSVQAVTPPLPVEQPSYVVEVIPERSEQLKLDTHLWDLNQRSWPGLSNSPITTAAAGTVFSTAAIAHHVLGGSYYMLDPNIAHGYNVADCEDPQPVLPTEVIPAPPVQKPNITYHVLDRPTGMYVSKSGGCEKWNFGSGNTWAELNASSTGHVNEKAEVTIIAAAHHPLGAIYYLDITAAGDIASTGIPAQTIGYNSADLTEGIPEVLTPAVTPQLTSWTDSYRAYSDGNGMLTPRSFVIMKTFTANDLLYPTARLVTLKQYDTILISGTFVKDGITYAAPTDAVNYVKNGVHTPLWPNIPLDDDHVMLHDELFSTTTTTAYREAVHTMTKRDYIVKAEGEFVKIADKFDKIWDVLPFRGKNKK